MEPVYTLKQIKEHWDEYQKTQGWRVLKDGKWKLHKKPPNISDGVTSAEMVKIKNYITFPTYLEKFCG